MPISSECSVIFHTEYLFSVKISEISALESTWQKVSIVFGSDLPQNIAHAIVWTNIVAVIDWRIYAPLVLKILIKHKFDISSFGCTLNNRCCRYVAGIT